MNKTRNYDKELNDTGNAEHEKYVYSFDYDVMHPFMIKAFEPFFVPGSLLELGSHKGEFTKRFTTYFDDITCVEASSEAIQIAKESLGSKVKFENSLFEEVQLPKRYDNIVL